MKSNVDRSSRNERLSLRVSAREDQLLRRAAAATDQTMTSFVMASALMQAERVLADRRWFLLNEDRWERFEKLLDAPLRELPKLRALLSAPSPFADDADA